MRLWRELGYLVTLPPNSPITAPAPSLAIVSHVFSTCFRVSVDSKNDMTNIISSAMKVSPTADRRIHLKWMCRSNRGLLFGGIASGGFGGTALLFGFLFVDNPHSPRRIHIDGRSRERMPDAVGNNMD